MARRTKEEAAATRDSILDAAEKLFVEQGVSRTTLQHIATAAGVTRGAIYWHFDDKGALFNAMMERAILPLEAEMQVLDQAESDDPLVDLRNHMLAVLDRTVNDPSARRVFEIATLKVEFVDEMNAVRQRRKDNVSFHGKSVIELTELTFAHYRGLVTRSTAHSHIPAASRTGSTRSSRHTIR
jgi:TetR/AcrR family acrAB operon transcriptional repressor